MSDSNIEITKNNEDWSVTEKIYEWIRNAEWQEGYSDVLDGTYEERVLDEDGKVNFNNAYANSNLWALMQIGNEEVGSEIYERIANIIPNIRDVETCNIHALYSISKELGVENPSDFDYPYPEEVYRLINIFSVNKNKLSYNDVLTELSKKSLSDNIDGIRDTSSPSNVIMSGFDPNSSEWTDEQEYEIRYQQNYYDGNNNPNGNNYYPEEPPTFEPPQEFIDTFDSRTPIDNMNADDYYTSIECIFSNLIRDQLFIDGGTILSELNVYTTPEDSEDINDYKEEVGVPLSFNANLNLDLVQSSVKFLQEFTYPEQLVLAQVELERAEQQGKSGDNTTRFLYDRTRKIRSYVNLIEMINNEKISNFDECGYVESDSDVDFLKYPLDTDSEGNYILNSEQEELLANAVAVLRNIVLLASYQRADISKLTKKYSINGTANIIKTLILEYLSRYFVKPEVWNFNPKGFTELDPTSISYKVNEAKVDSILGNIEIIEYFDNTNYMNISAGENQEENEVNPRYWEAGIFNYSGTTSSYTATQLYEFYDNIIPGPDENIDWDPLLTDVYDMGAEEASVTPKFYDGDGITVEPEGKFGVYGLWSGADTLNNFTVQEDIEPIYEWVVNTYTLQWLDSPLLSGWTIDDLLIAWSQTPDLETWQTDINVVPTFADDPSTTEWVNETFPVYLWQPNSVTNVWKTSVLIAYMDMVTFNNRWQETVEEYGEDNAVVLGWRDVDLLDDPELGWRQIPDVAAYLATTPNPTQAQWETASNPNVPGSTPFLEPIVNPPFNQVQIGDTFDPDTDWVDNPNVSNYFTNEPFDKNLVNDEILHENIYVDPADPETSVKYTLNSYGALEFPDTLDRTSSITGNSLKPMFKSYMGVEGEQQVLNNGNTVHPSVSYTPYLHNFKAISENSNIDCIASPALRSIREESVEISELSERIDVDGNTVNQWRSKYDRFHGYITEYEKSTNKNNKNIVDKNIDIDGPWNPTALQDFITSPLDPVYGNEFIASIADNTNEYYSDLELTDSERSNITTMLKDHMDEIINCKNKIIYQHGRDKYINHYTLFKKYNNFDERGRIWVRFNNHPLSLPLIDYSTSVELSQMDILDGPIINANSVYNNCCDFNIFNGTYLSAIGSGDIVEDTSNTPVDYNGYTIYYINDQATVYYNGTYINVPDNLIKKVYASINGFVSIVELTFSDDNPYIKIIASKDNNLAFEGWDISDNEKYVGMYEHNQNILLCTIRNEVNEEENTYLTPYPDSNNYDPTIGYTGTIRFNVFKTDNTVLFKDIEFRSVYDEYKFDITDINYHNQWRLTESDSLITLVYEGQTIGVSGEFNSYLFDGQVNYMDSTKNRTQCIGGSTICTIDLIKNIVYGYGEISTDFAETKYFQRYSNLGMIGVNS